MTDRDRSWLASWALRFEVERAKALLQQSMPRGEEMAAAHREGEDLVADAEILLKLAELADLETTKDG